MIGIQSLCLLSFKFIFGKGVRGFKTTIAPPLLQNKIKVKQSLLRLLKVRLKLT